MTDNIYIYIHIMVRQMKNASSLLSYVYIYIYIHIYIYITDLPPFFGPTSKCYSCFVAGSASSRCAVLRNTRSWRTGLLRGQDPTTELRYDQVFGHMLLGYFLKFRLDMYGYITIYIYIYMYVYTICRL